MKLRSMMIGATALFLGQAPQSAAQEVEPPHGWGDRLTVGACSKDSVPVDFVYTIWTKFNNTVTKGQERKVLSDAMEPFKKDLWPTIQTATGKVYADDLIEGTRISDKFLEESLDPVMERPLQRYETHAETILNQDVTLYMEVGVIVGKSTDTTLPCNRKVRVEPQI